MNIEIYEALIAAGVPEDKAKAHAAALDEALRDGSVTKADLQKEMEPVRQDLAVLKWMVGFIMVAVALPFLKSLF